VTVGLVRGGDDSRADGGEVGGWTLADTTEKFRGRKVAPDVENPEPAASRV
jgi:hypothetical protein